LNYCFH